MERQHHPLKKDTQVDRIIFFSDAVFAIAITLLVIDLKVPQLHGLVTEESFINSMVDELPQIIGFTLSFFIIGLYWTVHHHIFGFVINYSKRLIWLNLVFLFSIALMPFSTAIYSEYSFKHANLISPFAVYTANIILIGLLNFSLLKYIFNPKNKVAEHFEARYVKFAKMRALAIPVIFALSLLICLIFPNIGRLFLFTIPFAMAFIGRANRKFTKRNPDLSEN